MLATSSKACVRRLVDDPRVTEVVPENHTYADSAALLNFLPQLPEHGGSADNEDFSPTPEVSPVLRLNQLLQFKIAMPIKNQPLYRGADDVPSENYDVAWNGVCLVVQWAQKDQRATLSGGHVVLTVLAEVVANAGYDLRVQACTRACQFKFMHVDVLTFVGDDPPGDEYHRHPSPLPGQVVHTPRDGSAGPGPTLRGLFADIAYPLERFASLVNIKNHISLAEARARDHNDALLALAYHKAVRPSLGSIAGVRQRWAQRSGRAEVRRLIASVWIQLATMERLTREWGPELRLLETQWSVKGIATLFNDRELDAEYIEGLDLTLLRTSLEDSARRLDTNVLTVATAASALGAVAGGVAGVFTGG